ncbi:MAG: hypothetical protein U5L96_21110 [Owenweeksia sp.]|nr:hypothetical protein [Owenweeksia sp.]
MQPHNTVVPRKLKTAAHTRAKVWVERSAGLLSLYTQDGQHSAVTGGNGTEKLQVYSAQFHSVNTINEKHRWLLNFGADFISSASTDRIDFENVIRLAA